MVNGEIVKKQSMSESKEGGLLVEWPLSPEAVQDQLRQARINLDRYRATVRLAKKEIEDRNKIIRALTAFSYQAGRARKQKDLLKMALTQALQTTSTEVGAIVLINTENKNLSLGDYKRLSPDLARILTGRQFDEGAAILMPHLVAGYGVLLEHSPNMEKEEAYLLATAQLQCLVSLPLQSGEKLLGALIVGSAEKDSFSPADLYFLIALSQETATVLQTLYIRQKLWHLAENLLGGEVETDSEVLESLPWDLTPDSTSELTPQTKFGELINSVQGSMGVLFKINKTEKGIYVNLVTGYGISPAFTGTFADFPLSAGLLPAELLAQSKFIVADIALKNANKPIPLFNSLQEEGAVSMIGGQIKEGDESVWLIIAASTQANVLTNSHLQKLLADTKKLPSLNKQQSIASEMPAMPGIPIPLPLTKTKDDDMEKLLAAMMEAEEEVQRQNADLTMLNNISEMINRTLNLDKVLEQVATQTRTTLETDAVWVYLVDSSQSRLSLQVHQGLSERYIRGMHYLSNGKSLEEHVAQQNKLYYSSDITQSDIRYPLLVEQEALRAIALVPLSTTEEDNDGHESRRIVGVLGVAMQEIRIWHSREIHLLTSIANQVALAINNAQLYTKVKEDMGMLAASNKILQTMNDQLIADQGIMEDKLARLERKRR